MSQLGDKVVEDLRNVGYHAYELDTVLSGQVIVEAYAEPEVDQRPIVSLTVVAKAA